VSDESDQHERTTTHPRLQFATTTERDDIGHYLVVIEGDRPGRRVLIGSDSLAIGRDAASDLVLVDPDVSRVHARISLRDHHVIVEDQHSTNGTFVDGQAIIGPVVIADGSLLAIGQQLLQLERRSKREVARNQEIDRDLDRASQYVRSLLPAPLRDGAIQTDWFLQPSAQLGGDAFGYEQLDANTFVVYLIDVSGHGAGAAMHSVSVLNVLRQHTLPDADPREPAHVLASLNALFQMDRHDGMYFTIWYGVYDVPRRTLRYACAGHHPSYLVTGADRAALALKTPGLMIGAVPDARYGADQTIVPPGSALYLFSDGVFEVLTADGRQWRLSDFVPLLREHPGDGAAESRRLYGAVRAAARPGPLDDDFSLVVVTFA
jgi:serine phosphatase RsbU (regulator of sigma subunit)